MRELQTKVQKFLLDEGVAAWIETSPHDDGTVIAQSGGSRDPKDPPTLPRIALASEHYGRLYRLLEKKIPVTLQIDDENKFYDDDLNSFNIVGEIPGTDKADQVVMIGGHFDSWHPRDGRDRQRRRLRRDARSDSHSEGDRREDASHGAHRPVDRRGRRLARLARVREGTFRRSGKDGPEAGARETRRLLQRRQRHRENSRNLSASTTRRWRRSSRKWMKPFNNLGMTTLSIRHTGGTDHLSFDAVGLPGFQFIQDPIDYDSRTHHTDMDLYERIQEPDMKQMAVIVASFVYLTANRDEMIPRKPLPKPTPPRPQF